MAKQDKHPKRDWMVMGMDDQPLYDPDGGFPLVFKTEKAAIARAKQHVNESEDNEAWVYVLTHVVSRPEAEPEVEVAR